MFLKRFFFKSLFSIATDNLGTKFISLIIACILWVIVLNSRNVELIKDIPLEIITSPDVMIVNEIPEKISFRLSGPKAFLRSILDRPEEPIQINLSESKTSSINYRFFSDQIRVPIGVKVQSITPSSLMIKMEKIKRKEVPVLLELKGSLQEGYHVAHTHVEPSTVHIKGSELRIDAIKHLTALPIDLSHLNDSFEKEVHFDLKKFNIQIDGPLPRALVEIEPIGANFKIKNIDIRVLSDFQSHIIEKDVTVFVKATSKDLKTLHHSHFFGIVDLTKKPRGKYFETVKITLPKNVVLVKVVPDIIQVILE